MITLLPNKENMPEIFKLEKQMHVALKSIHVPCFGHYVARVDHTTGSDYHRHL
jgi:hypothetical protein